ncbi:putative phenazine biosynthesis PhzF protein [Lupinus albus]|uniref:Putative phenazine biosynthesis PhzF protein n=1 Tax=Lupinus albus TaxID=3870 RepID=A0A6A4QB62_LUPAL|nr:putative phenazine biosynthesis PhzF protein [Lupinus albus]
MTKKGVKYWVVDAFTDSAFKGNPAAVCLLEKEEDSKDEKWMQSIASEFNISETCYLTPIPNITTIPRFHLRWFTPLTEVILYFNIADTSQISAALGGGVSITDIKRTQIGGDLLVVVTSGTSVTELQPQVDAIVKCPGRGIIVSAIAPPGSGFDFYSRFFCPKTGINEDPVTGSAHCALALYWSNKLGKSDFNAYQASPRGGVLNVHLDEQNQRVLLRGKAVTVMEGCLLV